MSETDWKENWDLLKQWIHYFGTSSTYQAVESIESNNHQILIDQIKNAIKFDQVQENPEVLDNE